MLRQHAVIIMHLLLLQLFTFHTRLGSLWLQTQVQLGCRSSLLYYRGAGSTLFFLLFAITLYPVVLMENELLFRMIVVRFF